MAEGTLLAWPVSQDKCIEEKAIYKPRGMTRGIASKEQAANLLRLALRHS